MRKLALIGALVLGISQPAEAASLLHGLKFNQTSTQQAPQYRDTIRFEVPTGFVRYDTDTSKLIEFRVSVVPGSSLFNLADDFNAVLAQRPVCDFDCFVDAINGSAYSFNWSNGVLSLGIGDPFNATVNKDVAGLNLLPITRQDGTYSVAGPIPEPASWLMMLLGFGAIGASLRQRRTPILA